MTIKVIQQLLKKEMGLDTSTIGNSAISSAMRKRMQEHGLATTDEYAAYLYTTQDELHYLIEEVVIPETWFFRDSAPFATTADFAKKYLNNNRSLAPLRILSVPSSTGEEPYSIAISLLEKGLTPDEFLIDAIDISNIALQLARSGIYGKNSFRGQQNASVIDKYFVADAGHMHLKQVVKDTVNFSKNNLLASSFPDVPESYDIIFCRNLLIYFSKEDKKKALAKLTNLLRFNGLLVVGHSECGVIPYEIFTTHGGARSFAYLKSFPGNKSVAHPQLKARKPNLDKSFQSKAKKISHDSTTQPTSGSAVGGKKNPIDSDLKPNASRRNTINPDSLPNLDEAAILADEGHLEEARNICKEYLALSKDSARVYTLLGVVDAASGTLSSAEEHLRKAIYLEPNNHEALIHLSYIVNQRGDHAGAELLRRRAERARSRRKSDPKRSK